MPELDGIGVVRMLKKAEMPLIAFVTAYDEYAVRAFEVNAVDYLLKPVEQARLRETHQSRAGAASSTPRSSPTRRRASARRSTPTTPIAPAPLLERIPVRKREDILLVPVAQVASIVADGELLHHHDAAGTSATPSRIGSRISRARLDPAHFVRLGRGTLANIEQITKVSVMPGGTHIGALSNGQKLRVSRLQSRAIRDRLLKLLTLGVWSCEAVIFRLRRGRANAFRERGAHQVCLQLGITPSPQVRLIEGEAS